MCVKLKPRSMKDIRICRMEIVNSLALCEPSAMNGASNSSEWKSLTQAENCNPAR